MKITYFGHSCFEVEIQGKKILFDPFITGNALAQNVDTGSIKPDYILITHGHQDHIADVELIYNNSEPQIFTSWEVGTWFLEKGMEKVNQMNYGGSMDLGICRFKIVNAIHSSSMPDGAYGGSPMGFVVQSEESTFYYAGDTALTYDMKLIPEEFQIDFAILPIGDHFTMGASDAVKAAKFVETGRVIGMHYNSFPVIEIDEDETKNIFKENGIELILMNINHTMDI